MSGAFAVTMVVVTFVSLMIAPLSLDAQSPEQSHEKPGPRASFTAGASLGDGETALALSTGLGFRFSARLGLEFELAYARKLDFTLDLCLSTAVCVRGGGLPVTGRTVSLVPHVVIDLVPGSRRLGAYAQAGVGAGHVRQRYVDPSLSTDVVPPVEFTRSNVTFAVSLGGGVTVQIRRRFGLGIDVRSLHLLDDEANADRLIAPSGALSTLRIGSRVSWQF
jgi:hypothetical protein